MAPIVKKCRYCGKEFTAKSNFQVYCSQLCSDYNYQKKSDPNNPTIKPVVCKNCQKTFFVPVSKIFGGNSRKYCSPECRAEYAKMLYRVRTYPAQYKICKRCGKIFTPTRGHQKFCSPECGAKYRDPRPVKTIYPRYISSTVIIRTPEEIEQAQPPAGKATMKISANRLPTKCLYAYGNLQTLPQKG